MFKILIFLWFLKNFKNALFYIYLWQLKEYHIRRFLDYFRTYKGKKLFLNGIILAKSFIFIFVLFLIFSEGLLVRDPFWDFFIPLVVIPIYSFELFWAVKNIFQKRFKYPVFTIKSLSLIFSALFILIISSLIFSFYLKDILCLISWLLIFDIFSLLIFSFIVLLLEPFAILFRKITIKKAILKRLKHKNLIVIGITGSFGKTSTKEFLTTILSKKFKVLKTFGNNNSEMGISNCIIRELNYNHQVFVAEMAAYSRGGIKLLSNIVKPKIGIITGINEQHLATFGSMENLISAEGGKELINSLPEDGVAIFNGDNKYCLDLYKSVNCQKRIYTLDVDYLRKQGIEPFLWAEKIKLEKRFISFRVTNQKGESEVFTVNLLGAHNISNILAAIIAAQELKMTLSEIANACLEINQDQGAIKLFSGYKGINILDSSYSANPDGVLADLDYLNTYVGKKIIVMPCLIELGPASKYVHRKIGQKIGEVCDLAIITTRECFNEIYKGAVEKGMKEENILFNENPEEIVEMIKLSTVLGDTVLFEGRVPSEIIKGLMK